MVEYNLFVLCGSTKFKKEFLTVVTQLRDKGKTVLIPDVFEHVDCVLLSSAERRVIDQNYLQKINLADAVFVIDVEDYVWESTRKEIEYTQLKNKPLFYFSRDFKGGSNGN